MTCPGAAAVPPRWPETDLAASAGVDPAGSAPAASPHPAPRDGRRSSGSGRPSEIFGTDVIRNPILPGFNPDPSILRVGDDYFIATSTFVWLPGVRLFHSTDLARWDLIGHALAPGTHELRGLGPNCGIWAPHLAPHAAAGQFHPALPPGDSTTADYFDVDN